MENDLTSQGLECLRPAWAHIDLDALIRNLARLRETVGRAQIAAVVKADAYGHGAVHTARALEAAGVDLLSVAIPEEGVQLRRAGLRTPILVLGAHLPSQIPLLIECDLIPTISTHTQLSVWSTQEVETKRPVHLKIDTGMNRLGFSTAEFPSVLDRIRHSRSLELAGVLSHFAASNEPESEINAAQEKAWRAIEELLTAQERDQAVRHIANSAAALHHPWSRLDMVRFGLALYGLDPARRFPALEAVMSIMARIVQVRHLGVGEGVGYNHQWRAERESRIGILPLGYADGYCWRLGNRAQALAGGKRVKIIGNVSMDMTAIDLTDSDQAEGDEVTLLGGGGARGARGATGAGLAGGSRGYDSISAFDLAEWAGTIPYEILVSFGFRLPRVYLRDGQPVATSGRFVTDSDD